MKNFLSNVRKKEPELVEFSTTAVFKISGVPDYTFVERDRLSQEIDDYLETKDGVLLFLGYSKSGKTVFRKKHIEKKKLNIVTYRGNNSSNIPALYKQIATDLGVSQTKEMQLSQKTSSKDEQETQVGNKNVGHLKSKNENGSESSLAITSELYCSEIDINFLCNKLANKNVLVIIEDYHLVNNEFNRILSEDLKHFLDEEILFLLIGIPSSPNRALRNNPDLSGRMKHISFDYLSREEIKEIISQGCKLLHVEFKEDVIEEIIKTSFKNAYLVQYICRTILLNRDIRKTAREKVVIYDSEEVRKACNTIADSLDSDYASIYSVIISGSRAQQSHKAFNQYEEILKAIKHFDIEELEKGIGYRLISNWTWNNMTVEKIKQYIENGTYKSEQSFKSSLNTQIKNAIDKINDNLLSSSTKPILYVQNSTLYLTDLIFKFYINWKTPSKLS